MRSKGLVIVYTGNGKGKTTAALGLALRASGWNQQVLVIQFVKAWRGGEYRAIRKYLTPVKIQTLGGGFVGILGDRLPKSAHKAYAKRALQISKDEIMSNKWQTVVLDEILGALAGGLLTLKDVLLLLKSKPDEVNLVLTGRNAPPEILDIADLVTEMKQIKHPFESGILAKKGVDF